MGINGVFKSKATFTYDDRGYAVTFFDCTSDNVVTAAKEILAEFGSDAVDVDIEAEDSKGIDVSRVLFLALRLHSPNATAQRNRLRGSK